MEIKEYWSLYYKEHKKQKPCPVCGKPILLKSQGCKKHRSYSRGEQNKRWKGGANAAHKRWMANHPYYCVNCGKLTSAYQTYCLQCSLILHPRRWKGGRVIQKGGYIKIYNPDHPRADKHKYVWEHILIWEQVNNKPLPTGWVIHHLNGIPDDNRSSNLIALPNKKHSLVLQAKAKRIQELEALLNNQHQLL